MIVAFIVVEIFRKKDLKTGNLGQKYRESFEEIAL
jgi:hypothetical protein